ncbi:hypothetical protein ACWGDS_36520 [Streptomyces sp. NPDC055059]|uniref:hypothetical protein n=1 Tax=unclassified Streptomyces TaxID=2593676 RepID=UPI0033A468CF
MGMTRRMRRIWVTGAMVSLAVLTGCGSHGDTVPKTATGSLEQLAARAKCRPDIQTDADELRQATCGDGADRYILATFATDRGQAEWLDQADDYGGTYLIGRRWIAVGGDKAVTALRGRLGGTVETSSSHHSGSNGGGGQEEDGHSGHYGHRAS